MISSCIEVFVDTALTLNLCKPFAVKFMGSVAYFWVILNETLSQFVHFSENLVGLTQSYIFLLKKMQKKVMY